MHTNDDRNAVYAIFRNGPAQGVTAQLDEAAREIIWHQPIGEPADVTAGQLPPINRTTTIYHATQVRRITRGFKVCFELDYSEGPWPFGDRFHVHPFNGSPEDVLEAALRATRGQYRGRP
jgi:hypothetical protein